MLRLEWDWSRWGRGTRRLLLDMYARLSGRCGAVVVDARLDIGVPRRWCARRSTASDSARAMRRRSACGTRCADIDMAIDDLRPAPSGVPGRRRPGTGKTTLAHQLAGLGRRRCSRPTRCGRTSGACATGAVGGADQALVAGERRRGVRCSALRHAHRPLGRPSVSDLGRHAAGPTAPCRGATARVKDTHRGLSEILCVASAETARLDRNRRLGWCSDATAQRRAEPLLVMSGATRTTSTPSAVAGTGCVTLRRAASTRRVTWIPTAMLATLTKLRLATRC